jgi:hypothetical protein
MWQRFINRAATSVACGNYYGMAMTIYSYTQGQVTTDTKS